MSATVDKVDRGRVPRGVYRVGDRGKSRGFGSGSGVLGGEESGELARGRAGLGGAAAVGAMGSGLEFCMNRKLEGRSPEFFRSLGEAVGHIAGEVGPE